MDYIPTAFTGYANAVVIEGTGAVPYQFRPDVLLAVDVALNTGRPLLISGPPGCGKTSLARAIASGLNARYLSRTITSRTQIDDLFAEVDTLRRLADAQARMAGDPLLPAWAYLRPGLLWWAFDPLSADQRGARQEDLLAIVQAKGLGADTAAVSAEIGSPTNPTEGNTNGADVVVLLDEIDKADPDLPNDLLEPLDRQSFQLSLADRPRIERNGAGRVVVVLTTNGERDMPAAFIRRCITLTLQEPKARTNSDPNAPVTLESIAEAHFPGAGPAFADLISNVAEDVDDIRAQAALKDVRAPSTAEYLDTLRALHARPDMRDVDEVWAQVKSLLLQKNVEAGNA